MRSLTAHLLPQDRRDDAGGRPRTRIALLVSTAAAVATALLLSVALSGPSRSARADDKENSSSAPAQVAHRAFLRAIQQTLKTHDDRLIALARQVLAEPDLSRSPRDLLVQARIDVMAAESKYLNAKLAREIAEIAVKEYTEGVFVQDLATAEFELNLAKSALERSRDLIEVAKERQARIKEVADEGTAYGRVLNYDYGDRVVAAMIEVKQREFAFEVAQNKKKILVEYTKPKRIKNLESEVHKDKSDELAKQASWELKKAEVERLEKAVNEPWPASSIVKNLLALLDRAWPIEEKLHQKLDQIAKANESDEALHKEIREMANELETIIEEAEAAKAASDLAGLKSRIRRATRR